jgi:hypothetical protein
MVVSMRKSALKVYGGDLDSLYDVRRWDGGGESRQGIRPAKERGVYRPWRKAKALRQVQRMLWGS